MRVCKNSFGSKEEERRIYIDTRFLLFSLSLVFAVEHFILSSFLSLLSSHCRYFTHMRVFPPISPLFNNLFVILNPSRRNAFANVFRQSLPVFVSEREDVLAKDELSERFQAFAICFAMYKKTKKGVL